MAGPLNPIGFWSYTSSDDTHSGGRLSQLRRLLADQLQLLIGRRLKVHIFQDVAAIRPGTDWLEKIHEALGQSSFFIPIVTPGFLESEMCCQEVMRFRQREKELGRNDLIFPLRYVDTSDIRSDEVHDPAVFELLNSRQWIEFASLRLRPANSEEIVTKLADFAASIRKALRQGVTADVQRQDIARAPRSGMVKRDDPGPEMVLVPAGTFTMGASAFESRREHVRDDSTRPEHLVTIARPFWLGKYPVTVGEYAVFAAETDQGGHSWASPGFQQDDQHPVVNVSYQDAQTYLSWLRDKTGQSYRLPSEAEWEYAARAGTSTARYWGEGAGEPGEHARFSLEWRVTGGTSPVSSFYPNAFGLYNTLGNVWEWTEDRWHNTYGGAPIDGSAWTAGDDVHRVLRGGSWLRVSSMARSASRFPVSPSFRYIDFGFRCARSLRNSEANAMAKALSTEGSSTLNHGGGVTVQRRRTR